jgi:Domain of unknown function (DUF4279)
MNLDERISLLIRSKTLRPDAITDLLGVEPTHTVDKSKRPQAEVNIWCLSVADEEGREATRVGEAIGRLVSDVIMPIRDRIALIDRSMTTCNVVVTRMYHSDPCEAQMGWGIELSDLRVMVEAGLGLDFDEYDFSSE